MTGRSPTEPPLPSGDRSGRTEGDAWMRGDVARLRRHLQQQDQQARRWLAPRRRLQARLRREFRSRVSWDDCSAPLRRGPYLYYSRSVAGLDLPLHCRQPVAGGAEQVLLDPNRLGAAVPPELGRVAVSPDHRMLAFTWDAAGSEQFELRVLDLEEGGEPLAPVADISGDVVWAADSRTLFFVAQDRTLRPSAILRQNLDHPGHAPQRVLAEPDAGFHLGLGQTTDRHWLLFTAQGEDCNEVWLLEAGRPWQPPRCVRRRQAGVEYELDHHGAELFALTNLGAEDFRLLRGRAGDPRPMEHWPEAVPSRPGARLEDFAPAPGWLATVHRERGRPRLRLHARDGAHPPREVVLDEGPAVVELLEDGEPEGALRIAWSTPRRPWREERLDPASGDRQRLWTQRLPTPPDAAEYRCESLWAPADDGVAVPLTLIRRRDAPQPGPCLLLGYGAYGDCLEAEFDLCWLSLLDRGVSIALAHGRGGGELGDAWHRAGRGRRKSRSVTDFLACAEYLLGAGIAAPRRLAASGASAGGLLVAAAMNRRPELFRTVLLQAPFVDLLAAMEDPELPLTTGEYAEWGNPADPVDRQAMAAVDPRLGLRPGRYPSVLLRTAWHDSRVPCWQPARWLERLRAVAECDHRPRLLRTEFEAGHSGPRGRVQSLRETAFDYAFLLAELGIGP